MDRAMDYDDEFYSRHGYHHGSAEHEAQIEQDRELAQRQLTEINGMADRMMCDERFFRMEHTSSGARNMEYSFESVRDDLPNKSDYEHGLQMIRAGDLIGGGNLINKACHQLCREEAARYLRIDLKRDIEDKL